MRRAWPAAHRRRDAGPSWSAGRARVPCQSSALEDARPGCSRDIRPGMWTRTPGGWWPGVAGPGGWWPGVAGPGGWWPGVAGPGGWRPGVAGPGGWRPGVARPGGWRPGVARPGVWRPGVARPGGWRLRAARPGGGRSRHRSPIKGNPTGFRVTTRKRPAFPPSDGDVEIATPPEAPAERNSAAFPPSDGDVEIATPQKRRPNRTQRRPINPAVGQRNFRAAADPVQNWPPKTMSTGIVPNSGSSSGCPVGDHDAEGPRQVGLGVGEAEVRAEEGERLALDVDDLGGRHRAGVQEHRHQAHARKEIANAQTPIGAVHAVFLPWVSRLTSCATPSRPLLS